MEKRYWQKKVQRYKKGLPGKSLWQIVNTFFPLFFLWWASYKAYLYSPFLGVALSCLNQFFFIRTFIILHDCAHGSYLKSKGLQDLLGTFCGILTFTPFRQWKREHNEHHKYSGNLDKRGYGDIWTLTADEYNKASLKKKLAYHIYRFPLINFLLGPFYIFQIRFRFRQKGDGPIEDRNRYFTNFALVFLIMVLIGQIGLEAFLWIHLPIILLNNAIGTWLFFVQHQFEGTYWRKKENWDYFEASLKGASYLKLPRIFQWATGNIGLHHIHHLCHKIPNYRLQEALEENTFFQKATILNFKDSLKCLWLKLWDEKSERLISFGEYYRQRRRQNHSWPFRLAYYFL